MKGSLFCRVASKIDLPGILRLYTQPDFDDGKVPSLPETEHVFDLMARYLDYKIYIAVCDEQIVGTFAGPRLHESFGFERNGYSFASTPKIMRRKRVHFLY